MSRDLVRFLLVVSFLAFTVVRLSAQGNPQVLAYVSGGSQGEIVEVHPTGIEVIFSAKGGFRPEALDSDGTGRLFACDPSNSEIHVLEQERSCVGGTNNGAACATDGECPGGTCEGGDWNLTTIYDKGSATSPSPEQPVGCNVVGPDLLFGERSGSGNEHGLWVIRDAGVTPTSGTFNDPELITTIQAVSGDEVTDIVISPDGSALMTRGQEILIASPPSYDTFTTLISGLSGEATGLAVSSGGEVFVGIGDLGIVEVFDATGTSCGIYTDVSPLRPRGMEFDLADNLYIAAPQKTNGTGGDVLIVAPNGGPGVHQCGFSPPLVPAVPLGTTAPSGQVGIALPPSLSTQDLTFPDGEPLTAKQCSALFTVDPEFLNSLANPDCEIEIICRQMPLPEFELRTEDHFPDTVCMPIPNGNGNCIEIVVEGAECFGGETEVEWAFYIFGLVSEADRPGLLFSQDAGPTMPFTDNILTDFDPEVPNIPNDPILLGKKKRFGTGLVGVIGAPNRAPVADAGADQTVACNATVTIDGSASSDPDPIDAGQLTYAWTGPAIPAGAESQPSFSVSAATLGAGTHTYTLTVTDTEGLSSMDSVTITVTGSPPVIASIGATPDVLWPPNHEMIPVVVDVVTSGGCGAVSCQITGVTSSDPTGGPNDPDPGNGANTFPDWIITGPLTVDLRAERSEGSSSVNDARIYTITVDCADGGGNTTTATTQVLVYSDQGN